MIIKIERHGVAIFAHAHLNKELSDVISGGLPYGRGRTKNEALGELISKLAHQERSGIKIFDPEEQQPNPLEGFGCCSCAAGVPSLPVCRPCSVTHDPAKLPKVYRP